LAKANRGDEGFVTEFFACMDVGKVDFNSRDANCGDRIPEGDAGVRIGGGIEDDQVGGTFGLLNPGDKFAFDIGLAEFDIGFECPGTITDLGFDIREGGATVNVGFALAKKIEIRAVEE